jgi:rubrerythrin
MAAFAGESQARNRYTFYAKIASKEGHGGTEAPKRCPTCDHPQGWFIPVEANY